MSQPISRRSSFGNSGATTPRGAGLPRTSSYPGAAPQQAAAGGPVRLLPAVPRFEAAGTDGPLQPSSSSSLAAAAAAARPAAARENQPDNRALPVACTPRSMFPKTLARREAAAAAADAEGEAGEPSRQQQQPAAASRERLAPRRSIGGAALRLSVAAFRVSCVSGAGGQEGSLEHLRCWRWRASPCFAASRQRTASCLASMLQREAGPLVEEAAAGQPAAAAASAAAAPAHRATLRVPLPLLAEEEAPQEAAHGGSGRPLAARRLESKPSSVPDDSGEAALGSAFDSVALAGERCWAWPSRPAC